MLTAHELRKILLYKPLTGEFFWLNPSKYHSRLHGTVAGTIDKKGYVRIRVNNKKYAAHHLAWLYMMGEWPTQQIDHKNRIKKDNSWNNLRLANDTQQNGNKELRINNTSGYRGVSFDKRSNLWLAQIGGKNTYKYLGKYQNKEDAKAAYEKAAKEFFGEYYNG